MDHKLWECGRQQIGPWEAGRGNLIRLSRQFVYDVILYFTPYGIRYIYIYIIYTSLVVLYSDDIMMSASVFSHWINVLPSLSLSCQKIVKTTTNPDLKSQPKKGSILNSALWLVNIDQSLFVWSTLSGPTGPNISAFSGSSEQPSSWKESAVINGPFTLCAVSYRPSTSWRA